jgi:histidine ammonia-lyase
MPDTIVLDHPLSFQEIAAVAKGAPLTLSDSTWKRIAAARAVVDALVEKRVRGYGINTGVGALCDVIVDIPEQQALSRNILFSHACGVGAPLGREETRAVMAAQIANFSHGYSGVRVETVETLLALLNADILPVIPSKGSVGYLTHGAAIGLVLIGEGEARHKGEPVSGRQALETLGRAPLVLGAKEGLSLVNGTPCATGLASLALTRTTRQRRGGNELRKSRRAGRPVCRRAAGAAHLAGAPDGRRKPAPPARRQSAARAIGRLAHAGSAQPSRRAAGAWRGA